MQLQVLEYTTPDDAALTLGRVVVAAPEHGPGADVTVRWTLERDGAVTTYDDDARVAPPATEAVLAAPFRWDGTLHPAQWSVDVLVRWGEFELTRSGSTEELPLSDHVGHLAGKQDVLALDLVRGDIANGGSNA